MTITISGALSGTPQPSDAWALKPTDALTGEKKKVLMNPGRLSRKAELAKFWEDFWRTQAGNGPMALTSDNLFPLAPLPKLLRPFLFFMSLFGLYHYSVEDISAMLRRKAYCKALAVLIGKIMSFITLIFCWAVVVVTLYFFPWADVDFETHTFTSIVYLSWFLQNAIAATVYFLASIKKNRFKKLFQRWTQIRFPSILTKEISKYCIQVQWVVIFIILLNTAVFLAVFVQVYFIDYDLQADLQDQDPEAGLPHANQFEMITLGVLAICSIPICCFSVGFFTLICAVFRYTFLLSSDFLRKVVKENPKGLILENHRILQDQIFDALAVADNIFAFLIFSFMFNYMLLICLIGYEFFALASPTDIKLVRAFWCCFGIFTLAIISAVGGTVNSAARKLEKYLHKISLRRIAPPEDIQLVTFLLRFNGPGLGFTAWGMFTITRDVILSVASVFMTYLLLLVQLQPIVNEPHMSRNRTAFNKTMSNTSNTHGMGTWEFFR